MMLALIITLAWIALCLAFTCGYALGAQFTRGKNQVLDDLEQMRALRQHRDRSIPDPYGADW